MPDSRLLPSESSVNFRIVRDAGLCMILEVLVESIGLLVGREGWRAADIGPEA